MKRVIILESRGMIGGACESIRLFIQNMGCKTDLIIPKGELDFISKRMLRNYYGENIENIYEFFLPYSVEHTGGCEVYDVNDMKRRWRNFQVHRKELYGFLDEMRYDWIHLNGLGLYPILNRRYPMTIHVRQVFNGGRLEKMKRLYFLNQSRALICIDKSSFEPFREMNKRYLVIANPVDQTGINAISKEDVRKKYQIDDSVTVFVMAGTVSEGKGVGFVIDAFQDFCKVRSYPCKLLIAGQGMPEYKKQCSRLAGDNPDIHFLGQLSRQEMRELYRMSNYMIRADQEVGIGRTAWEALYSGIGLIIQGGEEILEEISKETGGYKNVFVYKPRNKESLVQAFLDSQGKKTENQGKSNAGKYAKIINDFIEEIMEAR